MTTVHAAGVLAPGRPVGHRFELSGWTTGVRALSEITVRISGVEAKLHEQPCPGQPPGSLGWRAIPENWVPSGVHPVIVKGPGRAELTRCTVRVGTLPEEPPLWLGELESPKADQVAEGHVVFVCGWALLDSRAPSLVEVQVEGGGTVRARTRLPRKDVPKEFPGFDDAAVSGFEARVPIDLPPGEERTLSLRVRYRTAGAGE